MTKTADAVAAVLRETLGAKAKENLAHDLSLFNAKVVDSFDLIALVAALEERFGIELATEDLTIQNFDTILSIARLVNRCAPPGRKP